MSFGWTAVTWAAIGAATAVAGTAYSVVSGIDATRRGVHKAQETERAADEANNRANAKAPDSAAAMAAAMLAGKQGQSSTMLTGPQGIDPATLTLGKGSSLGG